MTAFVGCDPGNTGAVCAIREDGTAIGLASFRRAMDVPVLSAVVQALKGFDPIYWAIEKPITVRGNAVRSVAHQWANYGCVYGLAAYLSGDSYKEFVYTPEPAAWKATMRVTADKKSSIQKVLDMGWATEKDLFASERARTMSADRAEAILLSHYCRKIFGGGL